MPLRKRTSPAPHSAQCAGPRGASAAPAPRVSCVSVSRRHRRLVLRPLPCCSGRPGSSGCAAQLRGAGAGRPGVSALRDAGRDSGRGRLARQSPRGQAARDGVPLAEPALCPGFLSRLPRPREVGVVDQVQTTEASRSPRRGQTRRAPGHIPVALSLPAPTHSSYTVRRTPSKRKLNILSHQRSANKNHYEIPFHTQQGGDNCEGMPGVERGGDTRPNMDEP